MQKVGEAMKSSESHKMNDRVQVDEFTIGGKEEGKQGRSYDTKKKKVLCAMELTNPHQHRYIDNSTGGTKKRGKGEPLDFT